MTKKSKPTTPGRRHLVQPSTAALTNNRNTPLKRLVTGKKRSSGRNNHGHMTARHRGGGHKRRYRTIDFRRMKDDIPAKVVSIEYDPNRTSFIALLSYKDGDKRYILAPTGVKVGDIVHSGKDAPIRAGNALPLSKIPVGTPVHNLEIVPGTRGQLVRSAGAAATLMGRTEEHATVKLPSGEIRLFLVNCRATIGTLSNSENSLRVIGKAGRARWKNKRPHIRGMVTNPVDGCMGGGEGKQKSYHPRSPWGTPAKGFKTRSRSKSTKMIVKDRRKK